MISSKITYKITAFLVKKCKEVAMLIRKGSACNHFPESKALRYALVLYPHRKHLTALRIVDFTIPITEIRTKDKPCASFFMQISFVHIKNGFNLADSRQWASLHYYNKKAQSTGLRACLFL